MTANPCQDLISIVKLLTRKELLRSAILRFPWYTKYMRRKRKYVLPYLFFFPSIFCLFLIIFRFSPTTNFSLYTVSLPMTIPFFLCIFLSVFSLVAFLTRSFFNGALMGAFIVSYLLLRMFNFREGLYNLLLIALFVTIFFAHSKGNG